jgi:hypothetical protein
MGLKDVPWYLRLVLVACSAATIVPRVDLQLGATLVGTVLLTLTYLRRSPAKVDVSAG